MKKPKAFKPKFNGSMIIFLHDNNPDFLAFRAQFTEDWLQEGKYTGGKRSEIMGRKRKFQVSVHIFDKDGFKCGENELVFKSKGGQKDISKTIFNFGTELINEIRAEHPGYDLDLINSFAEVVA